jgi:hypothetical protein
MHKTIAKGTLFLASPVREPGVGVAAFRFETVTPANEKMRGLPANSQQMTLSSGRKS